MSGWLPTRSGSCLANRWISGFTAMQLLSMLRLEGDNGNGNPCDLLDAFPGQGRGDLPTVYYSRRRYQRQSIAR